jgi:hypothetical protein
LNWASALAEAKSVQPEKRFGRWLKEHCGYTVRSAWNFISVHERLADHRERLKACRRVDRAYRACESRAGSD